MAAGVLAAVAVTVLFVSGGAQGGGTIWDGVFTEAQAEMGAGIYAERCQTCHVLEGAPIAPPLVGDLFVENWAGFALGELFEVTYTTMPPGNVGTLTGTEIAAIFAFMLSSSGAPAGASELATDVAGLEGILIQSPPPAE